MSEERKQWIPAADSSVELLSSYGDVESWDVDIADAGVRLDAYLADYYDQYSRSFLQKLVKDGKVLVDNRPVKNNYRLTGGEVLCVQIPQPEQLDVSPEPIPLEILYEDGSYLRK